MAAFGAKQGGKGKAHESAPKQGHSPKNMESPKGDCCKADKPGGKPGASGGFGC